MPNARAPFNAKRAALLREFVTNLAVGLRNLGFYESTHPMVMQVLEAAHQPLAVLLADRPELLLKFVDGEVIEEEQPLFNLKGPVLAFVAACREHGIECLTFLRGVPVPELRVLLEIVDESRAKVAELGGPNGALRNRGAVHISGEALVDVHAVTDGEGAGEAAVPSPVVPKSAYGTALEAARRAMVSARLGEALDASSMGAAVDDLTTAVLNHRAAMMGLASVRGLDEYTFSHIVHICVLSLQLGAYLGLDDEELRSLGLCALLHDVGKVFMPVELLRKQGRLSREETDLIQQHPAYGALVLSRQETHDRTAALVAFEHHMRYDLQGYPRVRRPRRLHPFSLIVSVPDVYDALTTERPYRHALTPHAAVQIMRRGQPGQFEPELLGLFVQMLGPYPAGSLVRLTDGRLAIVARPNPEDPASPWVRLLREVEGLEFVAENEQPLAELPRRNGRVGIVEALEEYPQGIRISEYTTLPEEAVW